MALFKIGFGVLIGYAFLTGSSLSADLRSANYQFHYGPQESETKIYDLGDINQILNHEEYDESKKTVLYAHGYTENEDAESIMVIINSYLERGDHNIITLNWTELSSGNYLFNSIPNMVQLSPAIASSLIKLFENGLDVDQFHLVGHSLGGQLVGAIGRDIKAQSSNEIILKRISALDPAFPGFYPAFFAIPLSASDAKFVDVIHTDSGIYGAPVSTGTVDFWPNGGFTLQPGCPTRDYVLFTDRDLCGHRRSWRYWAESVANKYPGKFNAVRAHSWFLYKLGVTMRFDPNVVMGIDCPENLRGKHYLQTNAEAPFARSQAGTTFT